MTSLPSVQSIEIKMRWMTYRDPSLGPELAQMAALDFEAIHKDHLPDVMFR